VELVRVRQQVVGHAGEEGCCGLCTANYQDASGLDEFCVRHAGFGAQCPLEVGNATVVSCGGQKRREDKQVWAWLNVLHALI